MEKFRLENGVLHVLINLYPYLLHEFDQLCQRLLRFPNKTVAIDLTDCDFVSTVFLSTMIRTHLEAQRQERKLVVKIGPSLEQFFVYASLDKTFNIEQED
ncbi:MAG: hypothetical protein JW909_08115 [Planctomycetes bacterium]|nr:hypothetical protein [Planctomycetota bacterium]